MQPLKTLTLITVLLLQACGGRLVQPTNETSSLDEYLTCSHIIGEQEVNINRVSELIDEKGQKGGANIGMVLLLGPAALPFIDMNGAEKKEIEAIAQRNKVLKELSLKKSCLPI